jgi:hypothetical protein
MSRLSEEDTREITSNLSNSFMTMDIAGILRPKSVEGAIANLAAYLINHQSIADGPIAQAHLGALESLAILGEKLAPRYDCTSRQRVQASLERRSG